MPDNAGPRSLRQLLDAVMAVSADLDLPTVLQRLVESAAALVDARYAALGVLDETGTHLAQFLTTGLDDAAHEAIGELPSGHGILGLLIVDPRPIRLPDLREHPDSYGFPPNHPPMRSFLGVPIRIRDQVFGNLYLTDKTTSEVFTDIDEELVVALAGAAGIAIENARLHGRLRDVAVFEDRERIARDLHDTVIQRLFATGLALQGASRLTREPAVQERIEQAVEDLDITVRHIRTAIFGLEKSRPRSEGVRNRILSLTAEAAGPLGFEPTVLFGGPVDASVPDDIVPDLLATLREALTNVARHAGASLVEVEVRCDELGLTLTVVDDGTGPPAPHADRGHGLANMAKRARRYGGSFELRPGAEGGSVLVWQVPVEVAAAT